MNQVSDRDLLMTKAAKLSKKGFFYILLVLSVLVALVLRLRAVDQLPIDFDEDDYLLAGQHYAQAIREREWAEIVNYEYNLEHPSLVKLVYGVVLTGLPQVPEIPQKPTSAPPADSLPQPHLDYLRVTSAVLGTLEAGHPGCAAQACLHWGLRDEERYFDPLGMVAGPVRLLARVPG